MMSYSKRDKLSKLFVEKIREIIYVNMIYIFGSTSRKDDSISSDIDICIIGKEDMLSKSIKKKINDKVTDFVVNEGILINWIYFSLKEWQEKSLPIINTIKMEGKLIWERGKM